MVDDDKLPLATGIIADFLSYTDTLPSPRIYRLWAAIHAVGACAERRIWTDMGLNALYPNLFVFLVGPPGFGKTQALRFIDPILRKSLACMLAPNDISKQSLLDALGECKRGAIVDGIPFDYHFMVLSIREMSNFMSKYDLEMAGILTDMFDCPDSNEEKKRTHNRGQFIAFPGVSCIMGTSTQNLGSTVSNEMWGSGFMARVIIVYSDEKVQVEDLFAVSLKNKALEEGLVISLNKLGKMSGPMRWTPETMSALNLFMKNQEDGAPLHNRLATYVQRRWMHLAKLCMIAALSDLSKTVTVDHMSRALLWLTEAEKVMPDVFRGMISHEDGMVFEEFRSAMWIAYQRSGKGLSLHILYDWLASRVPAHQVQRIIDIACAADYFRTKAGTYGNDTLYIPQMKPGRLGTPNLI